jgi:predicted dehydrogenase
MDKINIGVIGVGWFGHFHAQVYDYLAGANLVGVYDIDQPRTKEVAQELGVRAFASMEDLLADDTIQAVSICVKDQYHLKPVLAACQSARQNTGG